jgi:hypothetical protein
MVVFPGRAYGPLGRCMRQWLVDGELAEDIFFSFRLK